MDLIIPVIFGIILAIVAAILPFALICVFFRWIFMVEKFDDSRIKQLQLQTDIKDTLHETKMLLSAIEENTRPEQSTDNR